MVKLTNVLAQDAMRIAGLTEVGGERPPSLSGLTCSHGLTLGALLTTLPGLAFHRRPSHASTADADLSVGSGPELRRGPPGHRDDSGPLAPGPAPALEVTAHETPRAVVSE